MTPSPLVTRVANSEELTLVIAIADEADRLFVESGLNFDHLTSEHPFVRAERERYRLALERGEVHFALAEGRPVGFAALGRLDGHAYLEQLAVLPESGRRGIGRALVEHACRLSREFGAPDLLLTTYGHLAWNGPFYARAGFRIVPESAWGPETRAVIDEQRAALPDPQQRVAMLRRL